MQKDTCEVRDIGVLGVMPALEKLNVSADEHKRGLGQAVNGFSNAASVHFDAIVRQTRECISRFGDIRNIIISPLISDTGASENKSSIFEALGEENCEIGVHGNVYPAVSFLQGLALEVDHEKLDVLDPSFPVILTVRACKRVQP